MKGEPSACVTGNNIDGRWLLQLTNSSLVSMNIKDWEHLCKINAEIRVLRRQVLDTGGSSLPQWIVDEWAIKQHHT